MVTPPSSAAATADAGAVTAALEGLFSSHEARVLGAISLFVGYLCIFFTKILSFTNMYVGVIGIAAMIVVLLLLKNDFKWKSPQAWFRHAAVVIIGLVLTSPQLYFAWTVSVAEARMAAQADQQRQERAANSFVPPEITISPPIRAQ
jgi:hypothetical protein